MQADTGDRVVRAIEAGGQVVMAKSTKVTVSAIAGPLVGELAGAAVNQLPPEARLAAGGGAMLGAATGLKVAVAAKLGVIEGASFVALAASGFGLVALGIAALVICIADDEQPVRARRKPMSQLPGLPARGECI